MAYQVEKVNDVILRVKIVGEPQEVGNEIEKVCREIRKSAKVPGFRPGKAPVNIIKRYYEDAIRDGLVRTFLPVKIGEVLEKESITLLSDPGLEDVQCDVRENRFEAVVILEKKPEVEIKPEDYRGIKVKKTVREITDQDVDKVIEGMRNQLATWKEVDREAKEGDLVDIEYTTVIDGEEKSGSVSVVLGEKQLWPEVEKEVLGKKKGDEGEVEFTASENKEIYADAAGKKVKVKFKVKSVKEKELPEVNDEFAKKLGFESVEEMRKKIREDLEISEETREQEEVEDQIVDHLLSKVEVPVPPSLLNLEIRAQAENQLRRLAQMGVNVNQLSSEVLLDMVKPTAEKTVKVKLLLEKVAELEGIEVSDEELEEEIKKLADSLFGGDYVEARKSLEERGLLNMIREDIKRQKALDRLVELAEVEEVSEEK